MAARLGVRLEDAQVQQGAVPVSVCGWICGCRRGAEDLALETAIPEF